MNGIEPADEAAIVLIVSLIWLAISLAVYLWYAFALSKIFPKIGGASWKGWVPVVNEAEIFSRGGLPGWTVVFYFFPLLNLYALYQRIVATSRINAMFGRGGGMTALAILLPPVWASILAIAPDPQREQFHERVDVALPAPDAPEPTFPSITQPAAVEPTVVSDAPARDAFSSDASAAPAPASPAPVSPAPVSPAPVSPAPVSPYISSVSAPPAPESPAAPAPPPPVEPPAALAPPAMPAAPEPQPEPAPAAPAPEHNSTSEDASAPPSEPIKVHNPWAQGAQESAAPAPPPVIAPPPAVIAPVPVSSPTPPPPAPPAPAPAPAAAAMASTTPDDDDDDDDYGETIVVDRRPRIRWHLNVDGVGTFPLPSSHVLLGRKPTSSAPDTHALSVPDSTRTLSKVHARLDLVDDAWTITDLNSTNGVLVVGADGSETLLEPGSSVPAPERFILGKLGMSIGFEDAGS